MSLKIRVIPCLDVKDGRVVKGVQFKQLIDAGDPAIAAAKYSDDGADELCLLDISASNQNRSTMLDTVTKAADNCFIPLTVGGGITNIDDIRNLLNAGADKVSINSAAVKNPDLIGEAAAKFGNQCIVVAIDAKKTSNSPLKWQIFTHGGSKPTGIDAIEFARLSAKLGAGELLVTSMDRDGTRNGYDCELLRQLHETVSVPVIASGGAGTLQHLVEAVTIGRASAILAASIFHFGNYTIAEAKNHLANANIPVRLD